ncbi:MAG: 23S rRNA (guanosine(2251)-2'-O)-methyltransferase RlmB [Verrucomicrobiales bacterium]
MSRKTRRRPQGRENRHSTPGGAVPQLSEEELYDRLPGIPDPLVLILDGVEDPHNLGACLRSADAAGVCAVVAPKHHAVAVTDTVRRIACGGADHVPFVRVTNLARTMKKLQQAGLWIVGTADETERNLYELEMTGPIAIAMGAEGKGLRRLTAENCDHLVRIPMQGTVECLNVSVATGVTLFEVVRQRAAAAT